MDLVAKFWNFCHTLRHEGVDYSDYIEELTYLLFLKIAEERGIEIPSGCNWKNFINTKDEDLLKKYDAILITLSEKDNILGDMFRQPIAKIRSASALKKLLHLIDGVNWSEYNEDVLGAMFEGLLEKAANESKKGAGQYFTPRPLIEAIVRVMKPDPFEKSNFSVSDVACGTAGFIISSYEWWKSNNTKRELSKTEQKKLFSNTYFGQELVLRPRRMAQMNLYLHGISPSIKLGDTIYNLYDPQRDGQHSCILTNPPFGNKGADEIPNRTDFKIKTSNKQLNFIQHVYSILKKFGRAAIVLPDNVLTEDKALELWKHLFPLCNMHTILKLPNGTFLPYANVKAIVIFLQKGIPTKETWIFDARSNVESINKNMRPLTENHFSEFINFYGTDPNAKKRAPELLKNSRYRKFNITEIKKRGYNLDITWHSDQTNMHTNSKSTPEEALKLAIDNMQGMVTNLKRLLTSIEKES
jgi:type I restriction enzyme M protein